MKGRLCPKCGHFSLEFKPGYLEKDDAYVCSVCGESIPAKEIGPALDEDSIQRFPSAKDGEPQSQLNDFMKRKKQ